ncbi:MAG: Npt1/Npt2 family nucleotide transporter [Chlamydiales bacterium]|nr:Npt1/Npt2 family nucleotide transporter [Chlamydiales bacterium]
MDKIFGCRSRRKVIVMGFIFFLICIMHNILYNTKDALVITAEGSGAEAIPFIQLWMLFPMTCGITLWITRLLRHHGIVTVIQMVFAFFLIFFVIFACVLYPCRDLLSADSFADYLTTTLPSGFKGLIGMIRNWVFSVFFVMSELWAGMVTSVMFWSLANDITPLSEAKQSYSWIRVGGSIGCTLGGQAPMLANSLVPDASIYVLIGMVVVGCLVSMFLFRWVSYNGVDSETSQRLTMPKPISKLTPQSIKEQLKPLFKSRYLMSLATMVIGYNICMNLFELVWKAQVKEFYGDFNQYNEFLGHASTVCGVLSILLAVFTPRILKSIGWTGTAIVSPLVHLVCGIGFFSLLIFRDVLPFDANIIMTIAVGIGTVQFITGRATKHSLFDVTKDLAFIPLSSEIKSQGKAAVDGFGSRAGRSAASFVHQALLLVFTTVGGGLPIVGMVVIGVVVVWITATRSLGRQIDAVVSEEKELEESLAIAA